MQWLHDQSGREGTVYIECSLQPKSSRCSLPQLAPPLYWVAAQMSTVKVFPATVTVMMVLERRAKSFRWLPMSRSAPQRNSTRRSLCECGKHVWIMLRPRETGWVTDLGCAWVSCCCADFTLSEGKSAISFFEHFNSRTSICLSFFFVELIFKPPTQTHCLGRHVQKQV